MKFTTTLYNSQIDLMGHDASQEWEDQKVKCEIQWRIVDDQKKEGVSFAWFAIEAHLELIETNTAQEELQTINEHIHFDHGWTLEFEESTLMRGEVFQPTGIVIEWKDKKAYCTLIRQEGDGLPF